MRTPWLPLVVALADACTRGTPSSAPLATADAARGPAWLEALLDGAVDVPETAPEAGARRAAADFAPAWSVTAAHGAVAMDSTERVRLGDGAGAAVRPGTDPPGLHAASAGQGLFPGDRLETGEGEATLRSHDGALTVHLGPRARVLVPPFGASDLLVTRGVVVARALGAGANPRHSVDAPGARARWRSGSVMFAVGDGTQTLVSSLDAAVDVFAPLVAAGVVGDGGSLAARTLSRVPLAAGRAVSFDAAGRAEPPGPLPTTEAAATVWRARGDAQVAAPGGHLSFVRDMSRAGGQDLADVRALLPELRALPAPGTPGESAGAGLEDERDALENQLGAAMGRAAARADRGRSLAARGGDVGALFNLAELESLEALARVVLPLPVLDSPERARVP